MSERDEVGVVLALGSNLADPPQNLKTALQEISKLVKIKKYSSIYMTPPWGFLDQPPFLNQVITGLTRLKPQELLSFVKNIEKNMGRIRNFRNGPRLIDIDILMYGEQILNMSDLVIPHPRIKERAFVLVPLAELEPELVIPGEKRIIKELLQNLDTTGIEKFKDISELQKEEL